MICSAHIQVAHEDRLAKGQGGSLVQAPKNNGSRASLKNSDSISKFIKKSTSNDEKAGTFPLQINTDQDEPRRCLWVGLREQLPGAGFTSDSQENPLLPGASALRSEDISVENHVGFPL